MTTPGSNTLKQALSIQGKQSVEFFDADSRTKNEIGQFVSVYKPPVKVSGAFQPTSRALLQQLGIEFQKDLHTIFLSKKIIDVDRATQGDQFVYGGRLWQVLSNTNWFLQDGWMMAVCANQGKDPNVWLKLNRYQDPGETDVSSFQFLNNPFKKGSVIVIDVPRWTIGDGYIEPLIITKSGGLPDGAAITVNVSISGEDQGSITVIAAGGSATDSAGTPFPGLNSFGVVAGGLRLQHNVRLTISASDVALSPLDFILKRGVVVP